MSDIEPFLKARRKRREEVLYPALGINDKKQPIPGEVNNESSGRIVISRHVLIEIRRRLDSVLELNLRSRR